MPKHGPNRLLAYLAIHETVMEQFRRDGFVEGDDLEVIPLGADAYRMAGTVRCLGGVVVTVDKILRAVEDAGTADPMIQTHLYSYNVSVSGCGSVFRYDNAHRHPGHSDPNHRHQFDWKSGAAIEVRWVGRQWPTLGEVIEEARDWYWTHHGDLAGA